ncbi:MAG TPA: hypothetical protein VL426_01955 [Candidatus Binatia bacterium]|jgi:hypothetical protein|nr:hypothetical protein [Candidatus Binatia bacterium]
MERKALHPKDTPYEAYARALRFGAYALATLIARDFGLGRDLLIFALHHAMCRFEELGFPEAADALAMDCGFKVVSATLDQLANFASVETSPVTERPPFDPNRLN